MITNQILQKTIDGLSSITKVDFAVTDPEGIVLASTMQDASGYSASTVDFAKSHAESQVMDGSDFFKVYDDGNLEFILIAKDDDEEKAAGMGKVAAFQLSELTAAYKERFDRDNFIKNLLLDNLLLVDIYNRSKKLHIEVEALRVCIVIEIDDDKKKGDELECVRGIFGGKSHDFVTAVDEKNIIVVKQLVTNSYDEVEKAAETIFETFKERDQGFVRISYGTIVTDLKDVSRSYKEATMALDVGRIFFSDKQIIAYSVLGIGRLIYQLPIPLCKMFIGEIFGDKSPDDFDEETLTTINKFFENSLNVSETSRQLYIHRNTLVYRLDKIQKSTGLDLRVFDDAITFKIAMMVVEYMKYMEAQDF
ncbi:MAG: helix-turn-helix domain-containing protein [Lachnospiraceae bacterium]|nr:helix-turn-helix domain-containing protein [Lachnospiraceae bacterium]